MPIQAHLALKLKSKGRIEMEKHWIKDAIKHKGALHKELHVKEGKKIPAKKLNAAAKMGGVEGKRAVLAKTLKGLHHGKKHSKEDLEKAHAHMREHAK